MIKWIFIVQLLEQNPLTGEIQWVEAVRISSLDYVTCTEMVVDTVVMGEWNDLRIDPWCEPYFVDEKEDK